MKVRYNNSGEFGKNGGPLVMIWGADMLYGRAFMGALCRIADVRGNGVKGKLLKVYCQVYRGRVRFWQQ